MIAGSINQKSIGATTAPPPYNNYSRSRIKVHCWLKPPHKRMQTILACSLHPYIPAVTILGFFFSRDQQTKHKKIMSQNNSHLFDCRTILLLILEKCEALLWGEPELTMRSACISAQVIWNGMLTLSFEQ